ncbi:MAG: O-antigen ligase family protein [Sphingomonadaceae bacterium]
MAVLVCGFALWSLRGDHVSANRFVLGMAAAIFALVLSQLIPLPPFIWSALPGRAIMVEIDKAAGLGSVWRPFAMVPSAAWNAFYSLFVPLAVLLLSVQLKRDERFLLLPVVLGLGLFSGFLGLLQTISDPQGPLYFYNVTNNGSAVGLFANRNHQAIFLATLFPILAVFACAGVRSEEQLRVRGYAALGVGIALVPLVLVTGSRAGLFVSLFGLLSAPRLYRRPAEIVAKKRKGNKIDLRWLFGGFAVIAMGALTLILSRAQAIDRLVASDKSDDRFQTWPHIFEMAWRYFPTGSGVGSFVEIYKIHEPNALLTPAYSNHAHNDWLEVYMTLGLPGLILLGIAVAAYFRSSLAAFSKGRDEGRDGLFARLGSVIIAILALGSIGDYPLRTPILGCVFIIASLWLTKTPADRNHHPV